MSISDFLATLPLLHTLSAREDQLPDRPFPGVSTLQVDGLASIGVATRPTRRGIGGQVGRSGVGRLPASRADADSPADIASNCFRSFVTNAFTASRWPSVGASGPTPNSVLVNGCSAAAWRAELIACARVHVGVTGTAGKS